ncbi:hypothetical protein CP533_1002 [Ophiocordyceps camponoti-saundersi (nom. inval.)]|nr:hypothetical protein CP533_1002 [Ophiocordyceps camponoti-saundersi (nom. inval.)]
MIERLSVATAMVGLVADGGRISEKMMVMTPSPALTRALHEMKQCRSTVQVLFKALYQLEAGRLPFPERASWIAVEDVVASLTDCVLAVAELQFVLWDGKIAVGEEQEEEEKEEWEEGVYALCSRIHWQLVSMTLMATILKCRGVADASYASVSLHRRMSRILNPDTALSRRMRSMQDVPFFLPVSSCKTLADVPTFSLLPLPVTTDELGPGRELYSAAVYARTVGPFLSSYA